MEDVSNADLARKPRCLAPKIGTEPRVSFLKFELIIVQMQVNTLEHTPGPQYLPKERPENKKQPHYTFGFRRGGTGALKNQTSTPASVGPWSYMPEASSNPSSKKDFPRWTLPKGGRASDNVRRPDKNQTYDTRSAFGGQPHSKNKSAGACHFGTADRNGTNKLGTFKDQMTGNTKVKLDHPKF